MTFSGFPRETVRFFEDLALNNTRKWFDAHRDEFDTNVVEPAREFVTAMGARLLAKVPDIVAEPKIDRSIFRIHRDTRFSKDKRPYKNHLGILLWEGTRPKMECSGFYFHIEPPNLMMGSGMYMFVPDQLVRYRAAVDDAKSGAKLVKILNGIEKAGFTVAGRNAKRFPRGFPADHPRADLLRHDGLYAWSEQASPKILFSPDIVDYCAAKYEATLPLHRWLVDTLVNA